MKTVLVDCPARVNLSLKINETGEFKRICDTIDIYDKLEVSVSKSIDINKLNIVNNHQANINLVMNSEHRNINNSVILKAIDAFFKYTGITGYGTKIMLTKNIPSHIGVGGSYSDAAGVIIALNEFFDLDLSKQDLINIAKLVHPSVPYFIYGGYKEISGEKIDIAKKKLGNKYLLGISNLSINWEYILNNNIKPQILDTKEMYNCYEWMLPEELKEIKRILLEAKAKYASVNGVSSSVVGIFNDQHQRYEALESLRKKEIDTITCKSCEGIIIKRKYK